MESLLERLAPLLVQLAFPAGDGKLAPRTMVGIACVLLATLGAAAALGCLVAALWLLAAASINPIAAPAVCAVALIIVCTILMLIGTKSLTRKKTPRVPNLFELFNDVDGAQIIRDHKSELLIAAAVTGMLVGGSMSKRSQPGRSR
jgi:hypothetical protein